VPTTSPDNGKSNGWNEWSRYVLRALEDSRGERAAILKTLNSLELEFVSFRAQMAMRAGVWGALAGVIPVAVAALLLILRGG
jgi:hypothetical protein